MKAQKMGRTFGFTVQASESLPSSGTTSITRTCGQIEQIYQRLSRNTRVSHTLSRSKNVGSGESDPEIDKRKQRVLFSKRRSDGIQQSEVTRTRLRSNDYRLVINSRKFKGCRNGFGLYIFSDGSLPAGFLTGKRTRGP